MRSILDIFEKPQEGKTALIPMDDIAPSPYQPRLSFDEESLEQLAGSIRENGLIQPITVRPTEEGYEIIAGERRYRACRKVGFTEIPCYILSPDEDQAGQMALVENVQREDLSAIEEARAYVQIMRQGELTQTEAAAKTGKSQSAVANKIRLLNLPDEVQEAIIAGKISERHGRALLCLNAGEARKACRYIIKNDLNVRQTEAYVEKMNERKTKPRPHKTRGYSRNIRIGINSVNQCVAMITRMGIPATVSTEESDREVRMTVTFTKE